MRESMTILTLMTEFHEENRRMMTMTFLLTEVKEAVMEDIIVFQLEAQPISVRLLWDDYWAMHRQISRVCGVTMDDLVGIHHVKSPPPDLEELELQAVIAQKSNEIFHGQGVVLALTDVEHGRRGR